MDMQRQEYPALLVRESDVELLVLPTMCASADRSVELSPTEPGGRCSK